MLVPIAIAVGLTGTAIWRAFSRKPKGMSAQRRAIYEGAISSLKEPAKLRELATEFEREGLKEEAAMLRKRAAVRELPNPIKKERKKIFKAGMASKDPEAIRALAAQFGAEGCFGAERDLMERADTLLVEVEEEEIPPDEYAEDEAPEEDEEPEDDETTEDPPENSGAT